MGGSETYNFGFDGRGIVSDEDVHSVVQRLVARTVVRQHHGQVHRRQRDVDLEIPLVLPGVLDFVYAARWRVRRVLLGHKLLSLSATKKVERQQGSLTLEWSLVVSVNMVSRVKGEWEAKEEERGNKLNRRRGHNAHHPSHKGSYKETCPCPRYGWEGKNCMLPSLSGLILL